MGNGGKGFWLLLVGLAAACGSPSAKTDAAPSDGGSSQADARPTAHDQGQADKAQAAEGDAGQAPIVGRPRVGSYLCSVTRDRTSYGEQAWFWRPVLRSLADGSAYLARLEGNSPDFWNRSTILSLAVSSLALDGTLGTSTTVPVDDVRAIEGLATTSQDQGLALVWADEQGLHFASLDDQRALRAPPRLVTILDRDPDTEVVMQMAADRSGAGFAVALSLWKEHGHQPYVLFLDSQGGMRGAIRQLGNPPTDSISSPFCAPAVTATSDGYAFAWNDVDGTSSRVFFARTDASGNETVASHLIARTDEGTLSLGSGGVFARPGISMVETGGEFVAAWSEMRTGFADGSEPYVTKGAWSVVRLTRVDAQGGPTGISATLRAPEADIDEVEPVLTPFEGSLAVSWGRGSHIYSCAGCVPDHRIDLVLLDPASLSPVSNVATIDNPAGYHAGGLLRKQVAASGSSLLLLYDLTFHTSARPGSAVFTCAR